jgi:hypothetical protein
MKTLYVAVDEPDAGLVLSLVSFAEDVEGFPLVFPFEGFAAEGLAGEELAAGMVKLEEEAAKFAVTTPRPV